MRWVVLQPCLYLLCQKKTKKQKNAAMLFGHHDDAIQTFESDSGRFDKCLRSRQAISVLCNLHFLASATSLPWSVPDNEECFSLIASFCVCTTKRRIQLHDRRDVPTHSQTSFSTVITLCHHPHPCFQFFLNIINKVESMQCNISTADASICPLTAL